MGDSFRKGAAAFFFAILFFTLIPSITSAAIIGRWKLDEGTGTTATDSSGNGYNGTWSGTSSGNTGYYDTNATSSLNYSGSFSSGDDQVLVTGISTVVKSVTFWAYIPSLSGTTEMVSKSTSGNGFEVIINGGTIQFYTMGSDVKSASASSGDINLNAWNHIVATYNGGGTTMRLYINGSLSGSTGTAPVTVSNVDNLYFGTWGSGGRQFVGKLNDIRLYDVELNSTQVGNVMGGSVDPDTVPDSTAPTISSVATSSISSSGATITWTTNEAASTKVAYSLDSNFASSTSETDTGSRVTSHSKAITGLVSCTLYNFKVVSADAAGNYATSTSNSFTTSGCLGGATPNSVATTTVTVSAAATTTLSDSSRSIRVVTPSNFTATSSTIIIQIKSLDSSTVLDSIGKPSSSLSSAAGIVFDVKALINNVTTLDSFDTPVTVTYTYTDADISGLNESSLTMYHYANGSWSQLSSCSVDTAANTITCSAPHFSVFAIFGSSSSSSSSTGSGSTLPWCSSPNAPGWNRGLLDGGCKKLATAVVTPAVSSKCPYFSFTRQLKMGDRGEDVRALQKFLNCAGFTVAQSGSGSTGRETPNFAGQTLAAVKRFQQAYASDILEPIKAKTPTGIFGDLSKKKAYSLMTSNP